MGTDVEAPADEQAGALSIRRAIDRLVAEHFPGAEVIGLHRFGTDEASDDTGVDSSAKASGYGKPILVRLRDAEGERRVVLHTATENPFGHDRRADRAAEMILAHDTFGDIPRHVRCLDVGAIANDGTLRSLRHTGEFYVLTTFAEGHLYAEDLRRIARTGQSDARDVRRAEHLGRYLAALHQPIDDPVAWTRAVRDLLGSGEGIFGIVDGYPRDAVAAPPERLQALEERALRWRWRLRDQSARLVRTHGDFHPFNILFDDDDELAVLDASRGCKGDPADDLTALAINYVFFALPRRDSWSGGFEPLWNAFWESYRRARGEGDLAETLRAAPPFLAWRALVVANPAWYPDVSAQTRDAMLTLAERALDANAFDLEAVRELFA